MLPHDSHTLAPTIAAKPGQVVRMKVLPLALALLLALTGSALAQSSTGKPPDCVATNGPLADLWTGVAFAIDGDTMAGRGLKPHIRIWGIQAPELRDKDKDETAPGMRARAALADMLTGNEVTCAFTKYDRYCRAVGICSVLKGNPLEGETTVQLGHRLLSDGMAYGFYLDDTPPNRPDLGQRYDRAEFAARVRRTGLWPLWLREK